MFFTYKEVEGVYFYIVSSLAFKVFGVGNVIIKMNFEKLSSLTMYFMLLTKNGPCNFVFQFFFREMI